jgi:alpha-tubulin suppressor-like RCC1 family protein
MSIRKNTWDLDGIYDLTKDGQNVYAGTPALFSWGYNEFGQLGQSNTTQYSSPVQIPGLTWSSISGRIEHTLAIKTDGTLWAWGLNQAGELGQNNRTRYSSPVQIPGTTWSSISGGGNHSLATKTDGTLWAWGGDANSVNALGQNNRVKYSSPVQIPGTNWNSISANLQHSLATKTDGTLWGWGGNYDGELGLNNISSLGSGVSSPTQIPGTTWSSINAGSSNSLATKTDGTLWGWGNNQFGKLGQNNRTYYSSPVQIPGTTWSSISGESFAIKTDGTLWSWGYNTQGQLGQNNRIQYSSPVQIPGTDWDYTYETSAIKTDGTLWVWGRNDKGQLGQNNRTYYSSPVQIPGTSWVSISGGIKFLVATQNQ